MPVYPITDIGPKSFNVWRNNDNPSRTMKVVGGNPTAYPDRYWQLDRSSNRSNPKDASGWRMPSTFHVNLQSYNRGFSGGRQVWHPYPYDLSVVCDDSGPDWPEAGIMTPSLPDFPSGLSQRAEVRALLKLKDMKLNLPQAFAEREQTVALVAGSIVRVAKMFKAMKRGVINEFLGRPGRPGRPLKPSQISDAWLELQYGWLPLLSDCHGALEVLSGENEREGPRRYRYHVIGKVREDSKSVRKIERDLYTTTVETRTMHMCKVRLDYEPALTAPFQTLTQAGITNPLELGWELLPYSFVVDWFLPVGSWLSTLDATVGWKFLAGSKTEVTRTRYREAYSRGISPLSISASGEHSGQQFNLNRTLYSGSPTPRPPAPKNPASLLHLNNAMSLLLSAFGRGHHIRY